MSNQSAAHSRLCDEILFAVGSHPQVRLWPRRVGVAIPMGGRNPVRFGVKGEADLQGIMMPHGRMIAIEVKTGTGKLSPEQLLFKAMIEKFGGLYVEARSVQDALQAVKDALISVPQG